MATHPEKYRITPFAEQIKELHQVMMDVRSEAPDNPETRIARTTYEQALMWALKGVAESDRRESATAQHSRTR